jgi:hypothetical protein
VRQQEYVSQWYNLAAQEPDSWRLDKYESLK